MKNLEIWQSVHYFLKIQKIPPKMMRKFFGPHFNYSLTIEKFFKPKLLPPFDKQRAINTFIEKF